MVAVLSVCVTLPMVYNYVHHVRRQMHNEITYCKVITWLCELNRSAGYMPTVSNRIALGIR